MTAKVGSVQETLCCIVAQTQTTKWDKMFFLRKRLYLLIWPPSTKDNIEVWGTIWMQSMGTNEVREKKILELAHVPRADQDVKTVWSKLTKVAQCCRNHLAWTRAVETSCGDPSCTHCHDCQQHPRGHMAQPVLGFHRPPKAVDHWELSSRPKD